MTKFLQKQLQNAWERHQKNINLLCAAYTWARHEYAEKNNLVSHVLGGVVTRGNENITFAIELVKMEDDFILLTDIKLISMDEYLDLINLNLYIKTDEHQHTENNSTKEHS